jgi:ribonuclease J
MVSVAIAINDKGALVAYPEVEVIGLPETDAAGAPFVEVARRAVEQTFETLPKPRRRDPDEVAESLRRAVRAAIAERWGKKPICHVHVLVV